MKQRELLIFTLLDKAVAYPAALYHLQESGDQNDIEAPMFEELLCVVPYSECLRTLKVPNLPHSCNSFCRDCLRNKCGCDNHTNWYNSLDYNVLPCETCERESKESKNLVCKEFCNLWPISEQESA